MTTMTEPEAIAGPVVPEPGMEARTVPIPGVDAAGEQATANLRDPRTLTVRQKRPLQVIEQLLGPQRFQEIALAQAVLPPIDADLTPEQWREAASEAEAAMQVLQLDAREYELLFKLSEAAVWALLASWTLVDAGGVPVPTPRSVEEVGDMDGVVYDVLAIHTATMQATHYKERGFDLEGIENPDSPTGASDGSNNSSEADDRSAVGDSPESPPSTGGSTPTDRPSLEG